MCWLWWRSLPPADPFRRLITAPSAGRTCSDRLAEGAYLADFDITENAGEGSVRIGNRSLFYCQVGDPNGPLVLHNHGGPSSRLEVGLFALHALNLGLRFVCV